MKYNNRGLQLCEVESGRAWCLSFQSLGCGK